MKTMVIELAKILSMTKLSLLLLVILLSYPIPSAQAQNGNTSVTGHGNSTSPEAGQVHGRDTFTFNAIRHSDGRVNGSAVIKLRGYDLYVHLKINCLTVLPDGKTAGISGSIVSAEIPTKYFPPDIIDFLLSSDVVFFVRDNGEAAGSPPDEIRDFYLGAPSQSCQIPPDQIPQSGPMIFYPITFGGNIQVRP